MSWDVVRQARGRGNHCRGPERRGWKLLLVWLVGLASLYASSALADRNFTARFHTDDNGSIAIVGNMLMSCVQGTQNPPATCISTVPLNATGATGANLNDNNYNMAYVNVVGGTGIFNSSTANFTRPAGSTVTFAGLYWSGEVVAGTNGTVPPNAALKNQVKFSTPASGGFQTITASQLDTTAGIGGGNSGFSGFADVTALVQAGGGGTYAVANVQAATGQNRYAGWALIIVYHDATQPLRDLTVFDGYLQVSTTTIHTTISGFRTPVTGAFTTTMGAVAYDGDLGSTGDAMQLNSVAVSDAANPANNFYNSTVSTFGSNVSTRNPNFVDTLGFDADLINVSGLLPNGATSATVDFVATTGDTYFPDVLTFATDVFQPDFTSPNGFTKTVSDLNGGQVLPGDVLEYTVTMTNTGNDVATNVVMSDAIPANTTYVPGSLAILTGANVGAKTDASGDDQAEFNGTSVIFRLGAGANATSGGTVQPNGSTSVRFRVQVNAGTPANTVISNQATLNYIGATLGTPFTAQSDGDPTTPGVQPTNVTTAAPPTTTLSMTKTGAPDPVVVGQPLTYTLTVTNSGPSAAATTVVNDTTPANTTFASASAPAGWTITSPAVGGTGTVQFSNASLPVGTSTLTLVVNVNATAPAPGSISNTATVASPTDPGGTRTVSTSNNTVAAQDLSITKTGAGAVGQNQDIAYTIVVNNPGPLSASTVAVTDPTPTNTTFVSASAPAGWTVTTPSVGGTGSIVYSNASLAPGTYELALTLHTSATIVTGSTLTNTATLTSPSDTNPANNVGSWSALVRNPVPSVTKTFTPASVLVNADSTLSLVIANNAGIALSSVTLSDTLPTNMVVSPTPAVTNTCNGTVTATAGSGTVSLANGTLPIGPSTCTITVKVRASAAGSYVNTTGNVSSTQTGNGGSGTATLDVSALQSAGVTKSFSPNPVGAGGTSIMTIAFTNPNASAITGVAFNDTYPAGLANVATGTVIVANSCGGTLTAVNSGTTAALTNGTIPVAGCNIQINVFAPIPGSYVNSTGTITEGNAVDSPGASGTLTTTTLNAPTATKAFNPAAIQLGATSQMTITISNPNAIAINNAAFADTYPAGLQNIASGALVSNSCGGAVNAPDGGTSASFAGGTIPANGSCAIVVNVIATTTGALTNSTGSITSNNAQSGASASGTLTVSPVVGPNATKSFSPATVNVGDASQMTIAMTNPNTLPLTGIAFTDNYPAGIANAATGVVASNTCGGTVTAAASGNSAAFSGGTLAAGASCAIVINVVATAPGAQVNNTGAITSTNGQPSTGASGTLTVNPSADLSMVKNGPASVGFGGALTYTLLISNAGPSSANGATFSDPVPAGVTGINAVCGTPTGGAVCGPVNVAGNNVTGSVTTLPAGGSVTITINGTAPTSGASITNTASVTPPSGTTDPNAGNNSGSATTTLLPPQLTVSKSATPNPFIVGQPARYDINVQNTGSGATNAPITLGDTLASGITLASTSGANWSCTGTTTLSCTFSGTLAAGANTTLTLNVNVAAAATGANNTATASGGGDPTCPAAAHCSGTVVVPVSASADIQVQKTVDNATPNVGDTITFTVTASNNGPSNATGVVITDALPSGLAFVSATPSQGSYNNSTGAWTVGAIANGNSATLAISATVLMPGTLTNIATRTAGDQFDPDPSNNSASSSVNAQPTADLQVAKTVDNPTPNLGTNVTFTITLTNAGPDDATGVSVLDQLPAGLAFVSATPSIGTYNSASGVWTVGTVANGNAVTLAITATVTLPGDITNTASVDTSDEFDPNTANNSGGVTVNGQSADLQVVKTVDNANPVRGDTITFTITVTNNGPSNATGIAISDALPSALGFVSATPSQGTYNNVSGTWTLGSLAASGAGATATLAIVATVDADGGFTNTASVSAEDQPDPNPANNTSSVVVTPIASADLAIVKTGSASVIAGQQVAYALAVTNNGPSDAANVVLDDPTPTGLTFVSATAPCAGGFPCNLGTVTATSVVNVTVTFAVPSGASGTIENTGSVDSSTLDPNTNNNSSTVDTDVVAQADLHVVKTGPATVTAGGAISYSVVVSNNGPSDADGTTVDDPVPASITNITASCGNATGGAVCGAVNVSGNDVTSTITALPALGSVTLTINGTAPANGGTLNNTATATPPPGVTDPDTGDDSSTATTTVQPSADVSVTKTGPASATPGATVTYVIDVTNAGPSAAQAVSISDPTPPGLTFVSATAPCASGFPCALGDIASGATVEVDVTYSIASNVSGAITNTATATSTTADPDPSNNSGSATTPIAGAADLSVAKTGPATVAANGAITYTVVVANAGPSDVAGAQFTDPVPTAITNLNATCGSQTGGAVCGSADIANNVVAAIIPSLPAGGSVTYTITGTAPSDAQALSNTATIAAPAGVTDPNPANNSSTANTTVGAVADVSMAKSGPSTVLSGGAITYTLLIANAGPSGANGATYTDTLPNGITTITASCGGQTGGAVCSTPNVAGQTVSGAIATFPSGGTVTITINGVAPIGATTLTNTASVTPPAGVNDPNPGNNSSSVQTTVGSAADIAVTKVADNTTPNVGDTVNFTITASNNGPNDATGVAITDGLPFGLAFVSATPSQGTYVSSTGIWTVGDIANGATATLTIAATVTTPGPLTNIASVSASDQTDPDTSNNSAGASLNAGASADLAIEKTVDNGTPNVGDTVTFTITLSNNGPDDATGAEVTDLLPAGVTFQSAVVSQGTYDSASGIWTVGSIANGAVATLVLSAVVDDAGAITNIATITGENENDPVQSNNESGAAINGQLADIEVLKTVDNAAPNVGDTVTFTVTAHDNGPDDATGVIVGDTLPAGLTLVSATPSQGTYANGLWTIGTLNASGAGATATLSLAATVDQSGPITNTARVVASDQPDPNSTNDSASASLNGNPLADLAVVKTGPASALPGDTLVYTIVVTNNGPSDADNVIVDDALPAGTIFVSNSGACTSTYPCALGTIASGASATITTTVSVPTDITGTSLVNTASASSDTPDPDNNNNQDSVVTTLGTLSADLSIVKSGPVSAAPGSDVSYTLIVANNGPDTATNVLIDDPTPAGATFVSASAPCASGFPCLLGDLSNGGSAIVTVTFAIDANATGSIVNVASVSSDTTDPNPGNDASTVSTTIVVGAQSADLAITKTGPATANAGGDVTYTLAIVNNGPDAASNVVINDPTPAGLTFVSADAPCAAGFPCALGSLASGATASVNVTYAIAASAAGSTIVNNAAVSSDTADPNASNNAASATTTVVANATSADLSIVKSGPMSAAPGSDVSYTLIVANNGPDTATNVVIDDPTPAGATFVSASAPCASGFPCAIGDLPNGGSTIVSVTFAIDANATGSIVNVASVSSDTTDPNPNNDVSTVSTTIVVGAQSADLAITKTGPATANAGSVVTYTLAIVNNGPDTASNVVVNDPTPAGLTFVSADAPCAGGFPCALGALESGATSSVNVTYAIAASAAGSTIVNNAAVSSDTADPNASNNAASATTTVAANATSADLAVVKSGPASVQVGNVVTYTIVVTNNGPDAAVNAMVADATPTGLIFDGASAPCASGFPCALGTLAADATITISAQYTVTAAAPSTVINTAVVSSDTSDPNGANSSSSTLTTVITGGGSQPPKPVPADERWALWVLTILLAMSVLRDRRQLRR